jgi:hypothetical protein
VRIQINKIFLAPIWLLQIATSAKSFLDNPILGSRRLNQYGLHLARVKAAAFMCEWRRRRLAKRVRPEWREAFERDGFVVIHDVLAPAEFAAMRAAVFSYQGSAREMRQGDAITRRLAIDPRMLSEISPLRQLLAHKDVTALFHYVASFRSVPLHYVQTIVSNSGDYDPDPQETLHADSFHSSLKAWLFLNPVDADEGPFCYVAGSHRFTDARLAWEYRRSLAEANAIDRLSARGSPRVSGQDLAVMCLPEPTAMAVPENTLVVADTVGFHARGAALRPGERVEIWSYLRRNPFLPWLGADLFSVPGLAERRVGWLWALRDKLEPWLGQPWQSVGIRRPLDREPPAVGLAD